MSKYSDKRTMEPADSNAPFYWTPMTKDELQWLVERIEARDTGLLVRAISEHMRHIYEENWRRAGGSLVTQAQVACRGKADEILAAWDKANAPDTP